MWWKCGSGIKQAVSDVDTGGIKAEFKDTVENEDKEFETVTMGYKWPK